MKTKTTLLFWTLILFACSPGISSPQTFPTLPSTNTSSLELDTIATFEFPTNVTTQISTGPKIIVTVGTPNIGQGPDGNFSNTETASDTCTFVWAQHPLEELTVRRMSLEVLEEHAQPQLREPRVLQQEAGARGDVQVPVVLLAPA